MEKSANERTTIDRREVETLFERHMPALIQYARYRMAPSHIIRDQHQVHLNAEDCVQVACINVFAWITRKEILPYNFVAFTRKAIHRAYATEARKGSSRKPRFDYYIGTHPMLACEQDGLTTWENNHVFG